MEEMLCMKVLVVDSATHVKILVSSQEIPRELESGPTLAPQQMVTEVHKLAADWKYEALSISYSVSEANNRLRKNHGVVASSSRALLAGLSAGQSVKEFDAAIDSTIQSVYEASMT